MAYSTIAKLRDRDRCPDQEDLVSGGASSDGRGNREDPKLIYEDQVDRLCKASERGDLTPYPAVISDLLETKIKKSYKK